MSLQQLSSHRLPIALAAALALAAVVVLALSGGFADGAKSRVIGKLQGETGQQCKAEDNRPDEENPQCFVIASVTGVQVIADRDRGTFKAPQDGRIVAYGMSLGRPQKELRDQLQNDFPDGAFDGKATSQLSILKGGKKGQFKLLRKSPDFKASAYFDRDPIVTLGKPLRVRKGDFVGLTTPSWLPILGSPSGNTWRGSQKTASRDDCEKDATLRGSQPLRKKGAKRRFVCSYGARLLYWAYFQPKGKGGGDGGNGGGGNVRTLGIAPADAPTGRELSSGGIGVGR